jgi:hypothetical protein
MNTDTCYRIIGDIIIKNKSLKNGISQVKKVDISYGNKKSTNFDNIGIIQTRQPLTSNTPYFLVEVRNCGKMILCHML